MLRWCDCLDDDQLPTATWARQGEDAGRLIRIVCARVVDVLRIGRFGPEQLPDPGDIGCAVAVSEEAIVADAVLASGEHVNQKAANELWRCQRHGRLATRAFETVIFDAEGDAARIETDQAAVGNGHPVGVARQIGQHGFGPGEGFFGVNDPVDLAQRLQESIECRAINEPSMFSKELQLSGFV